jgi:hypothetical protein
MQLQFTSQPAVCRPSTTCNPPKQARKVQNKWKYSGQHIVTALLTFLHEEKKTKRRGWQTTQSHWLPCPRESKQQPIADLRWKTGQELEFTFASLSTNSMQEVHFKQLMVARQTRNFPHFVVLEVSVPHSQSPHSFLPCARHIQSASFPATSLTPT